MTTVHVDDRCAALVTPWNMPAGEGLSISIKPLAENLSQIIVRPDGDTSLKPGGNDPGRGPVGLFIQDNAHSTWTATRDKKSVLMIIAPTGRAGELSRNLVITISDQCTLPGESSL